MSLKDFDLEKLSKLIIDQLDNVTCVECCKYYKTPTTATCGHALCNLCWRLRRTCPLCGLQVEKTALKLDLALQDKTEHITEFGESFEELFKIKLDEFTPDIHKPHHVKEWLANSQNQFSAPVTADIQENTENVQAKETEREIVHKNFQQDDWDKIEEMVETVPNDNDKNCIGPMDIEEFDLDDKVYTTNNPRRSSRTKELKSNNSNMDDTSSYKKGEKNFNINTEKKSNIRGQNWKNVKRMKKEFSKLNKKNRNKLNVSIEMCKKSKHSTNKGVSHSSQQASCNTVDNTPDFVAPIDKNTNFSNGNQNKVINTDIIENLANALHNPNISDNVQSTLGIQDRKQNCLTMQNKINESGHITTSKVSFIKRSALHSKSTDRNTIHIDLPTANNGTVNAFAVNTDDIEITIKTGTTMYCIKKKENNVQLKINCDRETQTCLNNFNTKDKSMPNFSVKYPNIQHIQNNNNYVKVYNNVAVSTPNDTSNVIEKSVSTKKNTATADTSSVHFEITESVEKELADHMDNVQFINKNNLKTYQQKSKSDDTLKNKSQPLSKNLGNIPEDIEFLNDVDIFEGESPKEGNIQVLESYKNPPSEILMPTVRSKSKSQKAPNKRERDTCDVEDISNIKKIKMTQECNKEKGNESLKRNVDEDSEHINYDSVMSQVFANINADMENMHKTGSSTQISNTQLCNNKNVKQTIDGNTPKTTEDLNNSKIREEINQKCSENVFSLLEKKEVNSELLGTTTNKFLGRSHSIPLSPVLRTTLNFGTTVIENNEKLSEQNNDMDVVLSTPIQDDEDDDKSIVEETPQKSVSFLKKRNEANSLNNISAAQSILKTTKSVNESEKKQNKTDTEISDSVISIIDTSNESSKKPKPPLETPLTIRNFVGKITHQSTPVARKSLNFNCQNVDNDPEETLCASSVVAAKTTQEREFMSKAFEQSLNSPTQTLYAGKSRERAGKRTKFCIAGSLLTPSEHTNLKHLCRQRNWLFEEKYTKDLTHLVVSVDDENKSQRSVKYMCALAAAKWIISYQWVEKCLQVNGIVDEEPFEALDYTGEPGPRRSRLAKQKLFHGITFYCMPPFTVLDVNILKHILEVSGGRVVSDATGVRVTDAPALLLAEPANTQEDRFTYLAMELSIVPVNYEWAINCLGSYTLTDIHELSLCPSSLLPKAISNWPPELISEYNE